jgi:hypothetical protein
MASDDRTPLVMATLQQPVAPRWFPCLKRKAANRTLLA